jgi:hypothetical protein
VGAAWRAFAPFFGYTSKGLEGVWAAVVFLIFPKFVRLLGTCYGLRATHSFSKPGECFQHRIKGFSESRAWWSKMVGVGGTISGSGRDGFDSFGSAGYDFVVDSITVSFPDLMLFGLLMFVDGSNSAWRH